MGSLFFAIFYIFVPIGVFYFATEWRLPKFRVFLLSYLPLVVLGSILAVINIFNDNVYGDVISSSFQILIFFLIFGYIFFYPLLLLSSFTFIKIALKYKLLIRSLIAFVIGVVGFFIYISSIALIQGTLSSLFQINYETILTVGAMGVVGSFSVIVDYLIWDKNIK